jgi:hypothetical protein
VARHGVEEQLHDLPCGLSIRLFHQRPHGAHGAQPPAVVYVNQIETDQQGRRVT